LKVKVVSYQTPDSEEKVTAFYKKALGRYGNVITCRGNSPVGTPTTTTEGLNCDEEKQPKAHVNQGGGYTYGYSSDKNLELKAGSKRHQHIVGFENPKDSQTRFALVALDLPTEMGSGSETSN